MHRGAQGADAGGERGVRGDDADVRGHGGVLEQAHDLVVRRIAPAAAGDDDVDGAELAGPASSTTVTGSPVCSANASSCAISRFTAPVRSRHQPSGREPITFEASTSQRMRRP